MKEIHNSIFFLPDPLISPSIISGAVFLYFDGPFLATSPPSVVTPDSLRLLDVVKSRNPPWSHHIFNIANSLDAVNIAAHDTWDNLRAIAPEAFDMVYLAFPANQEAYRRVDNWVAASGYNYESLSKLIEPSLGWAELARHIFVECYLELDRDINSLYSYCDKILGTESLDSLIVSSYLLRLQVLLNIPSETRVLFTNERLAPFFEKLTLRLPDKTSATDNETPSVEGIDSDIIAWEFFRVLVSPLIDPLDKHRLALLTRIKSNHHNEVLRLRALCRELSAELSGEKSVVGLGDKAISAIDAKLRKELRSIFELDETTWRTYRNGLAADKVLWSSFASMLAGVSGSGPMFTAAGIIAALTSVGSNAFKARAERDEKLRQSDLALLHLLHKHK